MEAENVTVYDKEGKEAGTVELPQVFRTPIRVDLIRADVTAIRASRRQPYGPMEGAGMRHSVETWGKGRGVARVQRIKGMSRAAESPNNVGGRRAHPPRPERDWSKKINAHERRIALMSAIASTAVRELVSSRGHVFPEERKLPIILSDDVEELKKTAEVENVLGIMGITGDILRVKDGRKIRAGKGKLRNRRYRQPVGPLIVVSRADAPIFRAARNLAGVDVCVPGHLNTEILAPGGAPGRLTVYTKKAVELLGGI